MGQTKMELIHLIYTSATTDPDLTKEALDEILEQSRANNSKLDVTGILLFDMGAFFQVLEGDSDTVESLYRRIEADERHKNVVKLISEPIEERSFGEWSMGYPKVTHAELEEIPGLNDFFACGHSFIELEDGRAKILLKAFKGGQWRL